MNVLKISVIELIQALRQMIPNLTGKWTTVTKVLFNLLNLRDYFTYHQV
jgi:hypothetical protein